MLKMNHPLKTLAVLASLLAAQSFAQTPGDMASARARYKHELTDCAMTHPVVDNRNCVREARNTLAEIRRGRMNESWRSSDFEKNAVVRCDVHQGDDKLDCVARMHGRGKTDGSVAGGGILRELTTTTVVMVPPSPVVPASKKIQEENRPSGLMSNCRWVPPSDWVCK
jgi:hypothetical protein